MPALGEGIVGMTVEDVEDGGGRVIEGRTGESVGGGRRSLRKAISRRTEK